MTRHLIVAVSAALGVPAAILAWPSPPLDPLPQMARVRPLQHQPGGDVVLAQRPLFIAAASPQSDENSPGSPPALVGIVGRLPEAVGMVRGHDGTLHNLSVGAALGGWRLIALGSDAALFARGAVRRRVNLPAADEVELITDMRTF